MREKKELAGRGDLVRLARHFNRKHRYPAGKTKYAESLTHHQEHLKLVSMQARKEAEEHRRSRKARREAEAAG